jgi:tripartite motif-containing protein 2/3
MTCPIKYPVIKSLLFPLICSPVMVSVLLFSPLYASDLGIKLEEILSIDESVAGQPLIDLKGVAYDGSRDEVLVTDAGAHRVYIFDRRGAIKGILGRREELRYPTGIAVDAKGKIYVGEKESGVIKVFEGAEERFSGTFKEIVLPIREGEKRPSPDRMDVGPEGKLYVVDGTNGWILVFDSDGEFRYRIGKGGGSKKGIFMLRDVACDSRKFVYASSRGIDPLMIYDNEGNYLRPLRDPGIDIEEIIKPIAIAVDGRNRLWVLDETEMDLWIYDPSGHHVQTIRKGEFQGGLFLPFDMEFDPFDNLYILERGTDRLRVFSLVYGSAGVD